MSLLYSRVRGKVGQPDLQVLGPCDRSIPEVQGIAQFGYVVKQLYQERQRQIIINEIDLGELAALAQGRQEHPES